MKLIVITKKFPYFNTEAFLESEIEFYKNSFDRVTFLPIIKGPVRESHSNLSINDSYNHLYRKKKLQCLSVLFSKHFYSELFHSGKKMLDRNYLTKLVNQDIHYRILKNVIKNERELFDSECLVYCYWFSSSVYALLKLRQEFGLKYKVVCRAHRYDVYDETGEMPNRAFCIENIDQIFPISEDAIETFTKKYGHREKYTLARLGVKNHCFENIPSKFHFFHVF